MLRDKRAEAASSLEPLPLTALRTTDVPRERKKSKAAGWEPWEGAKAAQGERMGAARGARAAPAPGLWVNRG